MGYARVKEGVSGAAGNFGHKSTDQIHVALMKDLRKAKMFIDQTYEETVNNAGMVSKFVVVSWSKEPPADFDGVDA